MSAPIRSRLLTGTPVEEHGVLFPTPWIRVPVAAAGDTATLTVHPVTATFPQAVASGEVNASATPTALAVSGSFPAAQAASGAATTLTVLNVAATFPTATSVNDVNAAATLTVLPVTGSFPAVVALSGAAAPLTALQVQATFPTVAATGVNETASWGMIPIGVA